MSGDSSVVNGSECKLDGGLTIDELSRSFHVGSDILRSRARLRAVKVRALTRVFVWFEFDFEGMTSSERPALRDNDWSGTVRNAEYEGFNVRPNYRNMSRTP